MLALALLLLGQSQDLIAKLEGEYQHAGGQADAQALEAAIDRTVKEMSWFVRSTARSRLRESNAIPKRLVITKAGDKVKIAFDDRERVTGVAAAPVRVVGRTGSELAYTLGILGGALVQRFEGDGSGQVNAIRIEGDEVVVRVTVFSGRLPSNVVYELRYRRTK
jgi:hypothetical protein